MGTKKDTWLIKTYIRTFLLNRKMMLEDEKENADQILEATSTENIVTDMVVNYEDSTDTNTLVKAVIETNESDDEYVDPKDVAFAKEFAKTKAEQKQKLRDWFQQEEEKDKAFAKEFAKTKAEQKQKQRDWFQEEEKKEKDAAKEFAKTKAEQEQKQRDWFQQEEEKDEAAAKEFAKTKAEQEQKQKKKKKKKLVPGKKKKKKKKKS